MLNLLKDDRGGQIFLTLLAFAAIIIPILNLGTTIENPFHVSTYTVTLVGKYLAYALWRFQLIWFGVI